MAFIPVDKMKALREAALKGDERAKAIINKHFQRQDYAADLEDFFKPQPAKQPEIEKFSATEKVIDNVNETAPSKGTGNVRLDAFLKSNGIKEGDADYDEAVEDYYREFPQERPEDLPEMEEHSSWKDVVLNLIKDENEAVDAYDDAIKFIVNHCDKEAVVKEAFIEKLNHIKTEELEHIEELKQLL